VIVSQRVNASMILTDISQFLFMGVIPLCIIYEHIQPHQNSILVLIDKNSGQKVFFCIILWVRLSIFSCVKNPLVGLGCSSVVPCLPSMREALDLIPAPKKEKTKKKKTSPKNPLVLTFL
jgi:hypothetical protein